jgi:hypothetical protein
MSMCNNHFTQKKKQAGAELCQAQAQVDLPVEAEFSLTVEKVICALQRFRSSSNEASSMEVILYCLKMSKIDLHSTRVNLQLFDSKFANFLKSFLGYLPLR